MSQFDTQYDRRPTASLKWDALPDLFNVSPEEDVIPMWVADMDFPLAPVIVEAWQERMQHPIFGYSRVPDSLYDAIINWQQRYGWTIEKEHIQFHQGVVPALALVVEELTNEGDNIVISTPAYYPFKDVPTKLKRNVIECPLTNEDGYFAYDFHALEKALQNAAAYIFCHPHNPGGTVWNKEIVETIINLCKKHNVLLISDEIHADLLFSPFEHVPVMSLTEKEDRVVALIAPTKTFNLAGVQIAMSVTANDALRKTLKDAGARMAQFGPHVFAMTAAEAAYTKGEPWLNELMAYLQTNIDYVKEQLEQIDGVRVWKPQASYLIWMDVRDCATDDATLMKRFKEAGVVIYPGTKFGETGAGFFRINIASPFAVIEEAVKRMKTAFNA